MAPQASEEHSTGRTNRRFPGSKRPALSSAAAAVATSPSSQQQQQQQQPQNVMSARIISGSVGSLITALAVTPLEVAKIHFQNAKPPSAAAVAVASSHSSNPRISPCPKRHIITPCPKGCGVFVLNNGLFDCILPKCKVPYFDATGKIRDAACTISRGTTTRATAATPSPKLSVNKGKQPSVGTFSVIRTIFVKDGFRGIYAGLGPTLLMGVPSTALYYAVYDELVATARSSTHNNNSTSSSAALRLDAYIPLLAGSSARLMTTLGTAPLELVRTRQASMVGEGRMANSMREEFRSLVRAEGVAGLYKGLGPTLWRDVPFSGIYWLCLENFRDVVRPWVVGEREHAAPLQQASISFLSGAAAGMVAAFCTTVRDHYVL